MADKFKAMPDGTKKTALAMDILGKSGKDLIPLLNSGSEGLGEMLAEADSLGITLSTETAAISRGNSTIRLDAFRAAFRES